MMIMHYNVYICEIINNYYMKKCIFTVIFTLLCGMTMAAPVKYCLKGVLPDSLNGRKVCIPSTWLISLDC